MKEFTEQKYRITGVAGVHLIQGHITRNECGVTITLGTKEGVRRYLSEMNPLVKVTVKEIDTGKDLTSEFSDIIQLCASRFNQPLKVNTHK